MVRYLIKYMRLQKQVSREYQGTKYEKFWVVVPLKIIKSLGWKAGQELEAEVKEENLIVKKENKK
mgnify:CR=1 FL=1